MEVPCPKCRTRAQWEGNPYRPFCSERCKITDLGDWAAERYRVPAEDDDGFEWGDGNDEGEG